MSTTMLMVLTTNDAATNLPGDVLSPQESLIRVGRFLDKMAAGCDNGGSSFAVQQAGSGVAASGTLTFASLANGNTMVVGNQTFTAETSGASGNNQFNIGAGDNAAAVNAAAKISAHPSLAGVVTASATGASGVVTITAVNLGLAGNSITLTGGTHVTAVAMSGGTAVAYNTFHSGL